MLSSFARRVRNRIRRTLTAAMVASPPAPPPEPAPEAISEPVAASPIPMLFPPGHFYSPIADPADLRARQAQIWRATDTSPGIDWNVEGQLALLRELKPYAVDINYPKHDPGDSKTYFYLNDQFPVLDAEFLYAALCHFRPKRMIEIGCGFSSLITADVNRRLLGGTLDFTCIEPYPRQFLIDGVEGITHLVQKKVEDVELSFFDSLASGDILFIDSSHVSKAGSDVNYLFFEVIPRLRSGVMVHVHDIFLPDEYPKSWVIDEGRNWNEQYLLRAFLQFNTQWQVIWTSFFTGTRHTLKVRDTFPRFPALGGGGSVWIRRL